MRTNKLFTLCVCLLLAFVIGCVNNSESVNPDTNIKYNHPLAPAGKTTVFLDGVAYPFADNLNYAEYYSGEDLEDEYSFYLDRGYHSFFNIDLNATTNYVQFMLLNKDIQLGVYPLRDLGDSVIGGPVSISYELDDSLTNTKVLSLISGSIQFTKIDLANKRLSAVFTLLVEDSTKTIRHTIEGSFTDIFYKHGIENGEVISVDVSGNNWNSKFNSKSYFNGYGNSVGQGIKADYFTIYGRTEESSADGYESLTMFIKKPIHTGTYDIDSGCAYYGKFAYDPHTTAYVLTHGDTNTVTLPKSVTVTDYDVVRQRISGTFDFTINDNSPRSPLAVHNGRFIELAWW